MSCFVVPLVQAIATTAARRHEQKKAPHKPQNAWSRNLPKLELMLWGGSAMLIVDHIINGEVSWTYPFFTALAHEGGFHVMLREMLTVGLPMSALITLIYTVMCWQSQKAKV